MSNPLAKFRRLATKLLRKNGSSLEIRQGPEVAHSHGYFANTTESAASNQLNTAEVVRLELSAVTDEGPVLILRRGDRIVIDGRAMFVHDPGREGSDTFPVMYRPVLGSGRVNP